MRKPGGYAYCLDFNGNVVDEQDTFTCKHCSCVVHVKAMAPPEDMGGYCYVCSSLICKKCNYLRSLGKACTVLEAKLDALATHIERGGDIRRDFETFAKDPYMVWTGSKNEIL